MFFISVDRCLFQGKFASGFREAEELRGCVLCQGCPACREMGRRMNTELRQSKQESEGISFATALWVGRDDSLFLRRQNEPGIVGKEGKR